MYNIMMECFCCMGAVGVCGYMFVGAGVCGKGVCRVWVGVFAYILPIALHSSHMLYVQFLG